MALPQLDVTPGSGLTIYTLNSGQHHMADSAAMAIADDQTTIPTQDIGGATWTADQVTVAATTPATLIVAARLGDQIGNGRQAVVLTNFGNTDVFVGATNAITPTANSTLLPGVKGACKVITTTEAIYGIVLTGTQVVGVEEIY